MSEPQNPQERSVAEGHPAEESQAREAVGQVLRLLAETGLESSLDLFVELHPADQGEVLMEVSREDGKALLVALSAAEVARVLEQLDVEEVEELSEEMEVSVLSAVLDKTRPDVAADILRQLPEERSREVLEVMERTHEVVRLLRYADETAGGLMTPQYPVVKDSMSAAIALDILRLLGAPAEFFNSIFVVDDMERLVGSLSITRLALARPATVVREIMEPDVVSVPDGTDQEECARLMERYDLRHLPVLDDERRLIGVIQVEDVVDVVMEEATEDMYHLASIAGERSLGSLGNSVRRRLPWLYVNLATTFLAAAVIGIFESTIAQVTALAIFLPVIAGQGGIGGTQTLTLIVRGMALGEITERRSMRLLLRELLLGLIHGVCMSLVVGLVAYLWTGTPVLGLVVALAMLGNMVVAGLTGAGVPMLLRRFRMDPAISSAVIVTTFTDVAGFLMFLGMATALMGFLL